MESLSYIGEINRYIKKQGSNKNKLFVLEAGCGSQSAFDFGEKAHIIGVDISAEQLKKNKTIQEAIHGDIQTVELQLASVDVIVCWTVLEHLQRPELAMKNFSKALKHDGILIIGVPNIMSLKGLVTKFTPYAFHLWVYKHVYRYADVLPFPTYHKWKIAPLSLTRIGNDNGLVVKFLCFDDSWLKLLRSKSYLLYIIYFGLGIVLKIVTCGRFSYRETECVIVFHKSQESDSTL